MKKLISVVFAISLIAPSTTQANDLANLEAARQLLIKQAKLGNSDTKTLKQIEAEIAKLKKETTKQSGMCYVNGYTKSNGTKVAGYYRKCKA